LLLGVILYNLVGFILTFHAIRHEWRATVFQKITEKDADSLPVTVLYFNKNNFKKNKREFKHEGRWYDVIKIIERNDSLIVYAFDDSNETQLTTHFHNILKEINTQDTDFQSKTKLLFSNLIKEFLFEIDNKIATPSVDLAFSRILMPYKFNLTNPILVCDSPPPQAILI
jgi:hypothetical protein